MPRQKTLRVDAGPALLNASDAWPDELSCTPGVRIAGVDEAGRGPLAGPVVAAAVILPEDHGLRALNDSKKLASGTRDDLYDRIRTVGDVGVGCASVSEIDDINILNASLLAMERALANLSAPAGSALIDGNRTPKRAPCPCLAIVRGDGRVLEIAAASIIAKVTRDRLMARLAADFPGYGWETNQGYPTPAHRAALTTLGVTVHHRTTFAPVREALLASSG